MLEIDHVGQLLEMGILGPNGCIMGARNCVYDAVGHGKPIFMAQRSRFYRQDGRERIDT